MKKFFSKPYRWASIISLILIVSFTFVLLDTFVISKSFADVVPEPAANQESSEAPSDCAVTANSYKDENITITIETVRKHDTTIYVADVVLSDAKYLKAALAGNTYGRNIKAATSEIAATQNAIFAINGDYYGFRDSGYVLRNGVLYRDSARYDGDDEALVIDAAGNFSIIHESQESIKSLSAKGAWQILSFGPALVENGKIVVDTASEVSQSMNSNPRTAIGQISNLHYVFIVSDGRTAENQGLSLLELAQEFQERGCVTAYNLDGGGSSTMYFNGKIVNNPTDGRTAKEREVSDIVYLGY
jgi:exopolysaccharide biosynthesis protein